MGVSLKQEKLFSQGCEQSSFGGVQVWGMAWISRHDAHSISSRSSLIPLAGPLPARPHPLPCPAIPLGQCCLSPEGWCLGIKEGRVVPRLFQVEISCLFAWRIKGPLHTPSFVSSLLCEQSGLLPVSLFTHLMLTPRGICKAWRHF